MGGKPKTENSKKAAGNAKAMVKGSQINREEVMLPSNLIFPRSLNSFNDHRDDAEAKKAETARKKAEKDALLAADEKETSTARSQPKNSKTATKKTKGLDLSSLDDTPSTSTSKATPSLNATGIENALDALNLTSGNNNAEKVDRHPERRFKAAYAAYEARRMPEVEQEHPGLRKNQRQEVVRKEFEKSAENPFNQANGRFDSSKDELKEIREREREKVEKRLADK
ncbi:uncharacterized protein KY384_007074 [Bacidia gigantensis]|uniref:uncharacterized protein n=1 Tax=Bacidia gigantensis TaxID=2732470 RepID=UPI001D03CF58|nr:uncharacterized protein KY384_007074 [Bacidia gigantensis]KAG8528158.1 hypothetical protein KY384_007074 [Bacidia gigantensis]